MLPDNVDAIIDKDEFKETIKNFETIKKEALEYVEEYMASKKGYSVEIDDVMQNKNFGDFGSVTYTEKTRAVIKVQDGCDRFCSYCIIPYARGRVRSRKPESVIDEITQIAQNGIKEVVITGIHVASYGKDFNKEYRLIDLLEEINKINGIERIRLRFNRTIINNRRIYDKAK